MHPEQKPPDYKPRPLKRVMGIFTVVSTVCCVVFLVLLPLSLFLELPDYGNDGNIEPNGSISVGSLGCAVSGGGLWLFTEEIPYQGSIIALEGSWDGVSVTERRDWGWDNNRYGIEQVSYIDQTGGTAGRARYGDFPGIYYRHFEWRSSKYPWWTLAMSLLYPIGLTATLPSWWLIRRFGANLRFRLRTLLFSTTIIAIVLGFAMWLKS